MPFIAGAQGYKDSLFNQIPRVYSPNAAEMGKYGSNPVNYFSGLPIISIPITKVESGRHNLMINLSYHASGNKPEQHPGWVGQGWTLHAGGCINRIVRGDRDEKTREDHNAVSPFDYGMDPGYIFHRDLTQENEWTSIGTYESENAQDSLRICDNEPDFFQVCVEGLTAAFCFGAREKIQIISKESEDFNVQFSIKRNNGSKIPVYYGLNFEKPQALLLSYFEEFVVTKSDGTRYYFGGSLDYIEFSARQENGPAIFSYQEPSGMNLHATANTWMLRKIEYSDGEYIEFSYDRSGVPIVKTDSYGGEWWRGDTQFPLEQMPPYRGSVFGQDQVWRHTAHFMLLPLYLSRITSYPQSDTLLFIKEKTCELDYNIDKDILQRDIFYRSAMIPYDSLAKENYYCQLSEILQNQKRFRLEYTSSPSERLKLLSVTFGSIASPEEYRYSMEYNEEKLPSYNSRKTNWWGYYMSRTPYDGRAYNTIQQVRMAVDEELMQAEMLTRLTYPTGGWTEYEYEAHRYSKIVHQYPFYLESVSEGLAGGLRIKQIRDFSSGGIPVTRTYSYETNHVSTGILSGQPRGVVSGQYILTIPPESGNNEITGEYEFFKYEERVLNQLSTTDGGHVTYSTVIESHGDGSSSQYYYTNHDTEFGLDHAPSFIYGYLDNSIKTDYFTSKELFRGLLKRQIDRNKEGLVVKDVVIEHLLDTTSFLKAVQYSVINYGVFNRWIYYKIFTGFPALTRKTVTTYPDGDGEPVVETMDYEWNDHRQLVRTVRRDSLHCEERRVLCSGDMPTYGDYGRMQSAWILDRPVEETVLHDGAVVSSVLTTWRQEDSLFVPDCHYEARLWEPFTGDWPVYEGIVGSWQRALYGEPRKRFDRYDAYGNVLELTEEGAVSSQYYWSPDGVHPEASFRHMVRPALRYWHNGTGHREDSFQGKMVSRYDIDFTADYAGPASLDMMFHNGLGYSLSGVMDGDTLFHYVCPSRDVILPVTTLWEGTVSAGPHRLTLSVPGDEIFPLGNMGISQIFYLEGSTLLSYPVREERVSYENLPTLYESFESGGTRSGGFHSDHSWAGARTVSLNTPYGVCYTVDWMELCHDGVWRYRRSPFSGTVTVGGGALAVDNVRVYPDGAEVQSWTWWENGELRSMTDGKGRTESYAYDGLARLVSVTDEEGNTTKAYEYQYSNNE